MAVKNKKPQNPISMRARKNLRQLNTEIDMSGNSNEKVEFLQKVKSFFS